MGKSSLSSRIKARILADFPRFSIQRERVTEKRRGGPITFTRASLLTEAGTVFASGDGPDFEGALKNLAYRSMVDLGALKEPADG